MDEDGLKLPLYKVYANESQRQRLDQRWRWHWGDFEPGRRGRVDVGSEEIDERVDEQWAQVFDDEDRPPCDLRSKILHDNCALITKTCLLNCSIGGHKRPIAAFGDSESVD